MKKSKILLWLMTFSLIVGVVTPTARAVEPPETKSAAVLLADLDSGTVYFERNADTKMYPASLTKMMTAMLVIEAVERGEVGMEDPVTALDGFGFDLEEDGSSAQISPGETMTLRELLYCTLMASANEACNILAMYLSGDVASFVELMNARANELGCTNTHFANTHGLPNDAHYTTAHDLYLIAAQAMTYDDFATICDTAEYTIQPTNLNGVRALTNTNALISPNSPIYKGFYYEPAIGIKTGYTSKAGYCLASAAEKNGIRLLCIALGGTVIENANGGTEYTNFADSIRLYDWIFNNFSRQDIIKADQLIYEIPVTLGSDADSLPLRAQGTISAVLPNDLDLRTAEPKVTIYSQDGSCQAPIAEGAVLGEVSVRIAGEEYGPTYLAANRSVDLSYLQSMAATVKQTLSNTWVKIALIVVVLIAAIYLVLVARYRMLYRRRQRELHQARLQRQQMQEKAARDRVFVEARRSSTRARQSGNTPPPNDVTRDYFEEFFKDQ